MREGDRRLPQSCHLYLELGAFVRKTPLQPLFLPQFESSRLGASSLERSRLVEAGNIEGKRSRVPVGAI